MTKRTEIGTGISIVILLGTVSCVFIIGAMFSIQYEYNCTNEPATKQTTCTERRAWSGTAAAQVIGAIAGTGIGSAATIWKAGGLPKIIEKFFGGSSSEAE